MEAELSRRRSHHSALVLGASVVLAGLLPSLIGAQASAVSGAPQYGRSSSLDVTAYCRGLQQAEASMPGMKVSVRTVCDTVAARKVENQVAAAAVRQPTGMAGMAGMEPGSPVQFTVFQGPTGLLPAVGGHWNNFAGLVPGTVSAIHAVQLYDGKVLLMAGSGNIPNNLTAGRFFTYLWTPGTNTFTPIPTPYDMFCAGHTELANGNILILGGTLKYPTYDANGNLTESFLGSKQAYIFNVATERYERTGSLFTGRWYPTAVTMGNGTVVVAGGLDDLGPRLGLTSHDTDTIEKYTPSTGKFSSLPTMVFNPSNKASKGFPQYPGLVLMADGRLFYSGESFENTAVSPGIWNPLTGQYTDVSGLVQPGSRFEGATVLLPPAQAQKVMIMGGLNITASVATNSTQIINLNNAGTRKNPKPHYVNGPAMSAAKLFVGGVILPDYTVMETNGSAYFKVGGVNSAEDYNPVTNRFTVWNSPALNRMYHSEAFLLPSGQVAVLGSQPLNLQFEMHVSIYSPPYLFKGQRPTVAGTRGLLRNGRVQGTYKITVAKGAKLTHLSLIRPSATTHSTDPDQRLVDLKFTHDKRGYHVIVPANKNLTPAGWYMLFATDNIGRPSVAEWVHVS